MAYARDMGPLRLVAKPLPALLLCLWVALAPAPRLGRWITAGLALSALADLLIEFSFLAGLATFLLAHLAYTAGFTADARGLRTARLVPFALYGTLMYGYLWPRLGDMRLPVAVYVLAITAMMWRAAARVGSERIRVGVAWAGLVGAVLFALSDSLIALDRFVAPIPEVRYPILILYWSGQLAIAASARVGRSAAD